MMPKALPQKWVEYLMDRPETGMGYQIITATMTGGIVIRDVIVYNCCIVPIKDGGADPAFDPEKIQGLQLQSKSP